MELNNNSINLGSIPKPTASILVNKAAVEPAKTFSAGELERQTCRAPLASVSEDSNKREVQNYDNKLVEALVNNESAIDIAKEKYSDLRNQKQIANKMGKVVNKKTNTDIETADLKVEKQRVANRVERERQRNEILKCKQERKLLVRESRQKLAMQKFQHRKEKYGDLLLRHCRKKIKNADGKWEYQLDKNGDAIINMPNGFELFFLILFDSLVMFLNQTAEIFSGLNKVVFKIFWIILIIILLFVPPVRNWIFSTIGINIG